MKYNPIEIEAKWQKYWTQNQSFNAEDQSTKQKYYVLDMFPYPSGAGLHVGHPLGYIASDIIARFKRHKGFNVLHPQGYDSFGLPAEQYAIQTGQHPEKTTKENMARYRQQLDRIGFSFDWSREVSTSSPQYYRWTQWIFIQLFNSWYNKKTNSAQDISSLIMAFENNGNFDLDAVSDDNIISFSAQDWLSFSTLKQQELLLKYRMTFLAETVVNWCPALGTVLANDEIINGLSERGGHVVVQKKMKQWSMRISAYAERLLEGLETIDWTESLKETQRNWIGKSVGASVLFNIINHQPKTIEVFTTRPDTLFGVTFIAMAPEHPLVSKLTIATQKQTVLAYLEATSKRSERERMSDIRAISGVFSGTYAQHPFTLEPIPIWFSDYVLAGYGSGAVMGVPAGDQRDFAFANHFQIPIKNIFDKDISEKAFVEKTNFILENSSFLNGLNYKEATKNIGLAIEKIGQGKHKTNYRLRDAVFSRQRYWGEPFPVYYQDGMPQMIDSKYLPILLPTVEKYLPTEDGHPPLGNANVWAWSKQTNKIVDSALIDHLNVFPLELNTMPGWAGSSWYWLRYMDSQNQNEFVSMKNQSYWQNVDLYIGGSEHATGHLLYARFWNKFLKDRGYVLEDEPFRKLINQGMILGMSAFVYRVIGTKKYVSKTIKDQYQTQAVHVDVSFVSASDELDLEKFKNSRPEYQEAEFITDNKKIIVGREVEKMSKSKFNVVTPDDICQEYGADTLRLYEMFLGPLEQAKPWNTAGISGVFGFLKKLWKLYFDDSGSIISDNQASKESLKSLHKTIKKVNDDIANFSFNTSISQFMICVNELSTQNCHEREILSPLAILISPFAPHIAEEIWLQLGHKSSISRVAFPEHNPIYLTESEKEYPVSFNGKTKFMLTLSLDLSREEIEKIVLQDQRTIKQLDSKTPSKIIIVTGKIINLVG